ncbi:MAG TPA: hypothetical protein VH933_02325 [Aestuariivirgaceae bacterium]|jgi:hypothetical protein
MATLTNDEASEVGSSRKRQAVRRTRKKAPKRSRGSNTLLRGVKPLLRERQRAINKAYEWASDATRSVPRLAKDLRLPRRSDLEALTEASPIVMGAVGLGIGLVLGSLMPSKFSTHQGGVASHRRSARTRRSR